MPKIPLPNSTNVASAVTQCLSDYYGITPPKDTLPVDIERLLETVYDVTIVPVANLETEHSTDTILAADFKTIYVDLQQYTDSRYEAHIRFSLAHELGHIKLHRQFFLESVPSIDEQSLADFHANGLDSFHYRIIERQAQDFAGQLLMPYSSFLCDAVQLVLKNLDILYDGNMAVSSLLAGLSPRLAKQYGVSEKAVEVRIDKAQICGVLELDKCSPLNQVAKTTLTERLQRILNSSNFFSTT